MRRPAPLPGVDMEAALLGVGDPDLLEELFEQMARTWADGSGRISRALKDDGPERAASVAHALWGVAATLAVVPVRDAAARIEEALSWNKPGPTLDGDLKTLDEALRAFAEGVQVSRKIRGRV